MSGSLAYIDNVKTTTSFEDDNEKPRDNPFWPNTVWPEIQAAAGAVGKDTVPLDVLCRKYEKPLKTHLRNKFWTYPRIQEHAEDLLQDFITKKLLTEGWLDTANPARGKFRDYLRRSLDNMVWDWWKKQPEFKTWQYEQRRSQEDRDQAGSDAKDKKDPNDEPQKPIERMEAPNPEETAFDLEWCQAVLAQALERMEQDCRAPGRDQARKTLLWKLFQLRILDPIYQHTKPLPYNQLADQLGLRSPSEGHFMLYTAKELFEHCFYSVVAEYEGESKATRAEMDRLKSFVQNLVERT